MWCLVGALASSKRLGFAFPITERDGFSFHYGRFIQFPDRDVLFSSQDPIGNQDVLGNPNLKSETTVGYQAGLKHQFNDYLAGSFAVYSKDIYDLIASTTVTDQVTGNGPGALHQQGVCVVARGRVHAEQAVRRELRLRHHLYLRVR